MKVYRVRVEVVTSDRGIFVRWLEDGYFANRQTAEARAEELNNLHRLDRGEAVVDEIEVIED